MATVNVYTYYAHKLAWEKSRPRRSRKSLPALRLPRWRPGLCFWGMVLGSSAELIAPGLGLAGVAVGGSCGWTLDFLRNRTRKVMRILNGLPLEADDLRALRGY